MIWDGLSVIAEHGRIVSGVLVLIVASQFLTGSALRLIFGAQLTADDHLSLGLAGWVMPASLLSVVYFLRGLEFVLALFLILTVYIFIRLRLKPSFVSAQGGPGSKNLTFLLLAFLAISIPLRLVFVSKAALPSYFDSAAHYLLIKVFMGSAAIAPANYYHFGFHILAASTASALQADIAGIMLILGQMILAIMPISVFFLIRRETQSNMAGAFAVSLAAFGWDMPAHAVNWGKYPALMSLGLIPFALSLVYLLVQTKNIAPRGRQWAVYGLIGLSVLNAGFAHSRSLIVLALALGAWIISAWRQKLSPPYQWFILSAVFVFIALEIIFIQGQPVFDPLFDPYLRKGIWITVFVLALSIFALRTYPQFTFACVLAVCFLLGSLFIPIRIPGYGALTLLDRPFVEMILFLPLSLLGGLGLAGLAPPRLRQAVCLLGIGAIMMHAFTTYDPYPSDCCVIAGNDDLAAMGWMDDHLSAKARIGVSSAGMNVLASDALEGYAGGDAGIWIAPLIDRRTILLPYNLDFNQRAALDMLCRRRVSHLYVGEIGQTFDRARLSAHVEWYKPLLSMPRAKVYKVVGCRK